MSNHEMNNKRELREVFTAALIGGILLVGLIWFYDVIPNLKATIHEPQTERYEPRCENDHGHRIECDD